MVVAEEGHKCCLEIDTSKDRRRPYPGRAPRVTTSKPIKPPTDSPMLWIPPLTMPEGPKACNLRMFGLAGSNPKRAIQGR
jgi:hypothetical protein